MECHEEKLNETIYHGDKDSIYDDKSNVDSDDDFSVYDDRPDDCDFKDPIYDDEADKDHDEDLDTLIWDVYEDEDATHDRIFNSSQNSGLDEKIIFDEYQEYEEDAQIFNEKHIDLLDSVDSTEDVLEGVDVTNCIFEGGDVINYRLDSQISDKPATYYVDRFWEGI